MPFTGDPPIELRCPVCDVYFKRAAAHVRVAQRRGRKNIFCSVDCALVGRDMSWVKSGKDHPRYNGSDYRKKALEYYGKKCSSCGYDKYPKLLWVHHKDFGRTNHSLDNLTVLCIRCHLELHLEKEALDAISV